MEMLLYASILAFSFFWTSLNWSVSREILGMAIRDQLTKSDVNEPRKILKKMQNIFRVCIRVCGGQVSPHIQPFSKLFLTPADTGALPERLHPKPRSQVV
ncbi:hypothetical protein M413DRAFT_438305, partial [Hebeloma cylindrosporum]